jgi:D-3-phosphoglycerate dehydrogenase
MTKPPVAILDIYPPRYLEVIRRHLPEDFEIRMIKTFDPAEIHAAIADVKFILVGGELKVDGDLLDKAPNLKLLSKRGVGYDKIDVPAANKRGVTVCITPVYEASVSVAEQAIALLMGVLRQLGHMDGIVKKGGWRREIVLPTYRLYGKSVGVMGMGAIAREVVKRLKPFDVKIRYFDIIRQSPEQEKELGISYVASPDEVFAGADIVTMHTPLTSDTRRYVSKKQFASMNPNGVFINCSRGEVVDEPALIEALQSGHLSGAGLDVMGKEPPEKGNALLAMENVQLAPHWAAGDVDTIISQIHHAFNNIRRYMQGETIPDGDIAK